MNLYYEYEVELVLRCSKLNKAVDIDGTPIEMFKNGFSSYFILKLFNIFYLFIFLNPFTTGYTLSCGWIYEHDEHIVIRVILKETFLPDFLVILKHLLQNYKKSWKKIYSLLVNVSVFLRGQCICMENCKHSRLLPCDICCLHS